MTAKRNRRTRELLILLTSAIALTALAPPAFADAQAAAAEAQSEQADDYADLVLPETWKTPKELGDAADRLNSRLAEDEGKRLVPWQDAERIRNSLLAGKPLVEQLDHTGRQAYSQAMYFASLAAGYPADALAAARELTSLNEKLGWNWTALYRAGMLSGQKSICDQAIARIEQLHPKGGAQAFEGLKRDAAIIGRSLDGTLQLSDGTKLNPARCLGKALVIDLFMYSNKTSRQAVPVVRGAWQMFKDYPSFIMISMNMDRKESMGLVQGFIKAQGIDWPVFFDSAGTESMAARLLAVWKDRISLPTEIVVGPNGRVIYSGMPNDPVFYYAIRAALVQSNKGVSPASQSDGEDPALVLPAGPTSAGQPPAAHNADKLKAEQESKAETQLKLAEAFIAAGSAENAIRIYREILRDYPNSNAAVTAQAALIRLEKQQWR